jgi:hypothetical protein
VYDGSTITLVLNGPYNSSVRVTFNYLQSVVPCPRLVRGLGDVSGRNPVDLHCGSVIKRGHRTTVGA